MNDAIRSKAKESRVCLWQIAAAMGISEASKTRKLRHELPEEDQQRIIEIINQIAAEVTA